MLNSVDYVENVINLEFCSIITCFDSAKSIRLLTLVPKNCGKSDAKISLLITSSCSKFILYGKVYLKSLSGYGVSILGALVTPNSSTKEVISAACNCPTSFTVLGKNSSLEYVDFNRNSFIESVNLLEDTSFDHIELQKVANYLESIITDENDCNTKNLCVQILTKYPPRLYDSICQIALFKNLFNFYDEVFVPKHPLDRILGFSLEPISLNDSYGFIEPQQLIGINEQIFNGNKFLLVGPKNSGKSSLLKYVVNKLISHNKGPVAILDLDIGQPELSPPGMLSLHLVDDFLLSPPFHNVLKQHAQIKCIRKIFFGGVTPSDNPKFYLDCMRFVFQAYQDLPEPRPILAVNTMGWTQGLGLTLLIEQILMIQPQLIIQLELGKQNLPKLDEGFLRESRTFTDTKLENEKFFHNILIIQSPAKIPAGLELDRPYPKYRKQFGAPHHRALTMAAYLVGQLADSLRSLPGSGPNGRPILEHPADILVNTIPYRVNVKYTSEAPFTLATHLLFPSLENTTVEQIFKNSDDQIFDYFSRQLACLNASLIALVEVPCNQIEVEKSNGLVKLKQNPICECLGLGFVRAAEPENGNVFITTGLNNHQLVRVNALLRGTLNVPDLFFLEQSEMRKRSMNSSIYPPYVGPQKMQGVGHSTLPSKRQYPKTFYSSSFNTGDARAMDAGGKVKHGHT